MNHLILDCRFGFRTLWKNPSFTLIAVLTLMIGIGANTAIFSFVDGVLLKPLPYGEPERIVRVMEKPPGGGRNGISTLNFLDWQKENRVFDYMAAESNGSMTLTGTGEPIQLRGFRVSAHYFDIFGVRPALGRTFYGDEDQPGKEHVAILNHAFWETRFGADPRVVGSTVRLDGEPYTIVGVLPAGSVYDRGYGQIWTPLCFQPQNMTRNFHWFISFARLKKGVTLKQAQSAMDVIGNRIARDYPDSNKGWGVGVDPLADTVVGRDLRQSLYVLLAAVAMVLMIGCANLANLMLARGTVREREVAIRASLGAGKWRMVRQLLTESVLLSMIGGALGLLLGYGLMQALKLALPPFSLPQEANVTIDGRVLLFALGLCVITGVAFGMAPAMQATRANLAATMKEGGRGSSSGYARERLRSSLVISEVALAFVLLAGAGLLLRSFMAMQQLDPGFDATNVLTARVPIPDKQFDNPDNLTEYLRRITASVESVPGVRDVAFTSAIPTEGWGYGMPFLIQGRPFVDRANRKACFFKMVSPAYFRTIGMKLRKGRGLSDRDVKGAPPVTVINETMARKYFPGEDPIGKRILIQEIVPGKAQLGPELPWEVVGIVADEKVTNLDDKSDNPGIYVSDEQSPTFFQALVIRSAVTPENLEASVRHAVYEVNKNQPLEDVKTLERIKSESMGENRLRSLMLGVFAAVALTLSGIGIYGVISLSVLQRMHEMGIRAALGATGNDLIKMVLRKGMVLAGVGLALGFAGAVGLTRLLESLLFGVGERDPVTLVGAVAVLAGVAALACYIPARRAASVDPMIALRYE